MTRQPSTTSFEGFASPNFTQVPDELFDLLLPQLSEAELRVLLYIIRRTFGFKREADTISLSQMVAGITTRDGQVLDRGTGLSKATVARGLAGLRAKGVIVASRNRSQTRGDEPTTYRLRFKRATPEVDGSAVPLSRQRDTPPVSATRQAVSQPRDTQETESRNTDFDTSNGMILVDKTEANGFDVDPSPSQPAQRRSDGDVAAVGTLVRRRVRRAPAGEDDAAIAAAISALAAELGDRANRQATLSRALNLFAQAQTSRDAFIDLLYQARGEVRDRRQHPGKAPLPRNQMAYFFAVVEDRLGLCAQPAASPPASAG